MEVYYRPGCPYSENARSLLKDMAIPFKEVAIQSVEDLADPSLKAIARKHNHHTVPFIVFRDQGTVSYIGGFDKLKSAVSLAGRIKDVTKVALPQVHALLRLLRREK